MPVGTGAVAGDGLLVLDKWGGVPLAGALTAAPPVGATPYFGFDAARAILEEEGQCPLINDAHGVVFEFDLDDARLEQTAPVTIGDYVWVAADTTVLKGVLGYGATARIRTTKILDLSADLSLVVEIVDEDGRPVPAGAVGRIVVGNAGQFTEYTGGGTKETVRGLMASGDVDNRQASHS